jgi:hypothetical protein
MDRSEIVDRPLMAKLPPGRDETGELSSDRNLSPSVILGSLVQAWEKDPSFELNGNGRQKIGLEGE